jgi:hypothetical protein
MIPKEKAYDLVKKFNNEVIFTYRKVYFNTPVAEQSFSGIAFECKEIPFKVVDEIIEALKNNAANSASWKYFEEVKEEIIKL